MGDRECPSCEEFTLYEEGLGKWKCEKCLRIFAEEFLDGEEEEI